MSAFEPELAEDVKGGRLDLRYRIDVHDEGGERVHSLSFHQALEIVTPGDAA